LREIATVKDRFGESVGAESIRISSIDAGSNPYASLSLTVGKVEARQSAAYATATSISRDDLNQSYLDKGVAPSKFNRIIYKLLHR